MHNLKDSFLLAVITTYQTCFAWETELQKFTAVLAFTIIWWCLLTWIEGVKEKIKGENNYGHIKKNDGIGKRVYRNR